MSTIFEIPVNIPTAAEVRITDHCVERYIERVKPDLDVPDDIVLPLAGGVEGWWASTCLVFTGLSDGARDRRRTLKASKASAKSARLRTRR